MTKEFGDSAEGNERDTQLPNLPSLPEVVLMKKQQSSILLCIFLTFLA